MSEYVTHLSVHKCVYACAHMYVCVVNIFVFECMHMCVAKYVRTKQLLCIGNTQKFAPRKFRHLQYAMSDSRSLSPYSTSTHNYMYHGQHHRPG